MEATKGVGPGDCDCEKYFRDSRRAVHERTPDFDVLDQVTTSSRAIVFDGDGTTLATAQQEFTQHFPQPDWVEHDAEEIWSTQFFGR
jgi:hypothetical protein